MKIHSIVTAAVLLLACAPAYASPTAGDEESRRAKSTLPPSGKALIFVYRERDAADVEIPLWLDGEPIGATREKSFFLITVSPGARLLESGFSRESRVTLHCEAGRNYFIRQKVEGKGRNARASLTRSSYSAGRRAVHALDLLVADGKMPDVAAPAPRAPRISDTGLVLLIKTGSFTLSDDSQDIATRSLKFDDKSSGVVNAGLEWRFANGFAVGGELMTYNNDHVWISTGATGEMESLALLFTAKYYFKPGGALRPYVGAGIGSIVTDFSGAVLTGDAAGTAVALMGGVEYRLNRVGLIAELRHMTAKTEDDDGDDVDAGGIGLLFGLSVKF